jgi:hypothetical protein
MLKQVKYTMFVKTNQLYVKTNQIYAKTNQIYVKTNQIYVKNISVYHTCNLCRFNFHQFPFGGTVMESFW